MKPKLSYANVVATIALFVALGGASYAALKIPKNSVGSKQIRNGQVKSADVKDDSLTGSDVDESKLSLPAGPRGSQGPRGLQGPQGPAGAAGQDGSPDTAAQVLAKLSTVDGIGSLLDADLLDGETASDFHADWARMNGDAATIAEQSGGIEVTNSGSPAEYIIDFNEPLAGRALITSPVEDGDTPPLITVQRCGTGAGETSCGPSGAYNDGEHVHVLVYDVTSGSGTFSHRPFWLAALP